MCLALQEMILHLKKKNSISINSIYPSAKESPTTSKGGVVVVKLNPIKNVSDSPQVHAKLSYVDWQDNTYNSTHTIKLVNSEHYSSTSIRKAILLTRYVHLTKHYLAHCHYKSLAPKISLATGIIPAKYSDIGAFEGEMKPSVPKTDSYLTMMKHFTSHFEQEQDLINDLELIKVLEKINQLMQQMQKKEKETRKSKNDDD